ncbi:Cdc14-related protein phosphatase Clp1/Flp1 [Jimgerdemannia flammicorona]|uniref:protein-tyrosine-phosphatase n=1 Tax=Jimgerdemannia flammicorona TaxID=994334 RepID=A0A433QE66_9FUNG|nr:Cdc14-related protein phosphatase Clp1/Flp1 [Jimgerdemannia flammicorona]
MLANRLTDLPTSKMSSPLCGVELNSETANGTFEFMRGKYPISYAHSDEAFPPSIEQPSPSTAPRRSSRRITTPPRSSSPSLPHTLSIPHHLLNLHLDRLYFTSLANPPTKPETESYHYFSVDSYLVYVSFFSDFGPMNIAHVYRFCLIVHQKLESKQLARKKIVFYSAIDNQKRTNAAFLMAAYMMIVAGKTPEEAHAPLVNSSVVPFLPFRDAGYGPSTYHITILDCLRGLYKALSLRLLKLDEFDVEEYEFYERVENGDFNWLTPKFIAFASPSDVPSSQSSFFIRPSTAFPSVLSYFHTANVRRVVRLNNRTYDEKKFEEIGIQHTELYFPDGTCPPEPVLIAFLDMCEEEEGELCFLFLREEAAHHNNDLMDSSLFFFLLKKGVIAVHCKAGLGRTGTLIGAYLMKKYKFTAAEVIAYLRIMRPGSVVGPQQNYLASIESILWSMGDSQAPEPPTSKVVKAKTSKVSPPATPAVSTKPTRRTPAAAAAAATAARRKPARKPTRQDDAVVARAKSPPALDANGEERLVHGVPVQPRKGAVTVSASARRAVVAAGVESKANDVAEKEETAKKGVKSPTPSYPQTRYSLRSTTAVGATSAAVRAATTVARAASPRTVNPARALSPTSTAPTPTVAAARARRISGSASSMRRGLMGIKGSDANAKDRKR